MNPGACKHFSGTGAPVCKAGVEWAKEFGTFRVAPCIQWLAVSKNGSTMIKPGEPYEKRPAFKRDPASLMNCVWLELPTERELAEDYAESEAALSRVIGGLAAVPKHWRKAPFEDRMEFVKCPMCAGQLRLVQSRYNGHVHGLCSTAGCLNWME